MMKEVISKTTKTNNTMSMVDGSVQQGWKTPIPYLFGGLALMLCLIAIALLILACSFRKSHPNNNNNGNPKPKTQFTNKQSQSDVKIVVIMAGDENPTYLAKPLPCPMVIPYNSNNNFVERV